MMSWAVMVGVLCAPILSADRVPSTEQVYDTAASRQTGAVSFEIRDSDSGALMPGRLTFVADSGSRALFKAQSPAPHELALRDHVLYSLSGTGAFTVPVGSYQVYGSRGMEWSLHQQRLVLKEGDKVDLRFVLEREVDTTGYVNGDFHLHTLQYSGHGDCNVLERVISIVGEGVEFAVATDHNHHTTYDPAISATGAGVHLSAVTGNEVSTPIGHFNAFPLDPQHEIPNRRETDAHRLFAEIRKGHNEFGVVPIIQVNHPRWAGIDYFGQLGLDPITGVTENARFSTDFDCIELFNENACWGYYDSDAPGAPTTSSGRHWALGDWFRLLNRGHRFAAVGNSDSHTVRAGIAGVPRNYIVSETDEAAAIRPQAIVHAIRRRAVFTTTGPFVQFSVNGIPMGGEGAIQDHEATLDVHVQAASWIDCDRVKIVVNGDVVRVLDVPDVRTPTRLHEVVTIPISRDCWICLLVEGDDSLDPVVPDSKRPILPLAVTSPVWIDADGDGRVASLAESMAKVASTPGPWRDDYSVNETCFLLHAMVKESSGDLVLRSLESPSRWVQLSAIRAAERLQLDRTAPALEALLDLPVKDPFLEASAIRALGSLRPSRREILLEGFLKRHPGATSQRYIADILDATPATLVLEWKVLKYFPNPKRNTLLAVDYGPESDADLARVYAGKGGAQIRWQTLRGGVSGRLDLTTPDAGSPKLCDYAIAYAQTYVYSESGGAVLCAMGSDDGCRVFLNGEVVIEDRGRHGAAPFMHVKELNLRAGWNRVLVKVENGAGAFGLYFRFFGEHRLALDD